MVEGEQSEAPATSAPTASAARMRATRTRRAAGAVMVRVEVPAALIAGLVAIQQLPDETRGDPQAVAGALLSVAAQVVDILAGPGRA